MEANATGMQRLDDIDVFRGLGIIAMVGRNSIVYVCLNQIVIKVLFKLFRYVSLPILVSHVSILLLSMAALYCLSMLFTGTKLKVFIGK